MTFPKPRKPKRRMTIEVEGREIGYKRFFFPDGQPHIALDEEIRDQAVLVTISITSANSLFELLLVKEILDRGYNEVELDILYLMGSRMDRPIDEKQPFTLKVVTEILMGAGFEAITVLDPHSEVSLQLLNATLSYPFWEVEDLVESYSEHEIAIVVPDDGAVERVSRIVAGFKKPYPLIYCHKHRDSQTGKLSSFSIDDSVRAQGKLCFIIDDICDGGGTFSALATMLKQAGATKVVLFVTHGIFSKGMEIPDVDEVHTTDSYGPEPMEPPG